MTIKTKITQPADPYDRDAWANFYAANPGWRRGVGADGVNDDTTDAAAAAAAEASAAADKAAADQAVKDAEAAAAEAAKNGTSDKEAELLKEVMKNKTKAKEAADALKATQDALKAFEGVDVEKYRKMVAAEAEAEEAAALARGEFDRVKESMKTAHQTELSAKDAAIAEKDAENARLLSQIAELTVGADFSNSKFITEETVYTPRIARKTYGDHFEFKEGRVIGYDKPVTAKDRTPLVDASGEPLPFDAALKQIVDRDPDKQAILREKKRPGSASAPSNVPPKGEQKQIFSSGLDKVKAGVGDMLKGMDNGGIKLS